METENKYLNILAQPGADINDLLQSGCTTYEAAVLLELALQKSTKYNIFSINEFMALEIKPRNFILKPIMPTNGLALLYSKRGVGKTHMAIELAITAAVGGDLFDKYEAPQPVNVLYIDGEMAGSELQIRIAKILKRRQIQTMSNKSLQIISNDLLTENSILNLITTEGQRAMEEHLHDVQFLIIDNLSTLCNGGRENESESWQSMQDWLLKLRKRGISVLLIHHAGKNDTQRGTSKKEDIVDTVIKLKHPTNYNPADGVKFEVHYEKNRGFYGGDAAPFEASYSETNGIAEWKVSDITNHADSNEEVLSLAESGLSIREIANKLDMSKSSIGRILQKTTDYKKKSA